MVAYIIIITLSIMFSAMPKIKFSFSERKKYSINGMFFSFLIIALFVGFRLPIGVDDPMYIEVFNTVKNGDVVLRDIELSYIFFSYLIGNVFGMNYHGLFLLYSLLSFYYLYRVFDKCVSETNRRPLAIALFFSILFFDGVTLMRQFLAIAVSLYAQNCTNSKVSKWVHYILAVFFHMTAVFLILSEFIFKLFRKHKYKTRLIVMISAFVFQFLPVQNFIKNILINSNLANFYYVKYYLLSDMNTQYAGFVTLTYVLLYIIMINRQSKINSEESDIIEKNINDYAYLYIVSMFIFNQFGWLNRLPIYLIPYQIMSLTYFPKYFSKHSKYIVYFGIIIVSIALFVYTLLTFKTTSGLDNPFIPYGFDLNIWT